MKYFLSKKKDFLLKNDVLPVFFSEMFTSLLRHSSYSNGRSKYLYIGLGWLLFVKPLRKYSCIWRRYYCRYRTANLDLCLAPMAIVHLVLNHLATHTRQGLPGGGGSYHPHVVVNLSLPSSNIKEMRFFKNCD